MLEIPYLAPDKKSNKNIILSIGFILPLALTLADEFLRIGLDLGRIPANQQPSA
jgi:hypothetical protein